MSVEIADGSTYSITYFTVPGGTQGITPTDINDNGEIVGFYATGDSRIAVGFVSTFVDGGTGNPTVTFGGTIADPAAEITEAYAVSDNGTIFGAIGGRSGALGTEGFSDAAGDFTTVNFPAAVTTVIYGTNNLGDVVGYTVSGDGTLSGFALGSTQNGPINVVGNGTTSYTFAYGINDSHTIVGAYDDSTGLHGFIDTNGQITTIDEPDGVGSTRLYDINSEGQIAGSAFISGHYVPFVYQAGNFTLYTGVTVIDGRRIGINDLGQLTGESSQGGSGFVISQTPACYTLATLISTCEGDQHVETLVIGDHVVTAFGERRPIKWIGRRSYSGPFLAANPSVQPIRFRAGSLGGGLPRRDLLVSPEHAMFLGGLLIPARCLVNGNTVVQERGLERVEYFHIELDSHDVLLAEGAPSESFLDDHSRGAFQNGSEFAVLYPNAPAPGSFCAAKVEDGPELEAIRRRLDGGSVQEVRLNQTGLHEIIVRPGASAIRLATENFYAPGDSRRLGAAISSIALNGAEVPLEDPRLATGWHGCEGAWRWTNGAALVMVSGACRLRVAVAELPPALLAA